MQIRNTIRALASPAIMLLLAACGSMKVSTMEVEDARLHERTSFAWVDRGNIGPQADAAVAQEVSTHVRQVSVSELNRKGYQEAPAEQADMLVSYQVVVTEVGLREGREPVSGMSPQASMGPGDPFRELRDRGITNSDAGESMGSLLVFITDRQTGRILWRGTAEALITSSREGARQVPSAVRQMFEKFPARAGASR